MLDRSIHCQNDIIKLRTVQAEFLETLLEKEAIYPWNPAEPETEEYLAHIEQEFSLADWSQTQDVLPRAEGLFSAFDRCWSSPGDDALCDALWERFGECVPKKWLGAIAAQAQTLASQELHFADRLVQCVQPILSQWGEEDLYLFARPFVYAMRSGELEDCERVDWEGLSPIEQARYTLKIARYALKQLETKDSD